MSDLIERLTGTTFVDLAQEMTGSMPQHPAHPPFIFTPVRRHGDNPREHYDSTNELIVTSGHSGTHLDGLGHVSCNLMLHGGHRAGDVQRAVGLAVHGMETVEPIVRRGVLLDVARSRGVDVVPATEGIGAEELAAVAADAGVEVRGGDCVLVRTGLGSLWGDAARYFGPQLTSPGIALDAAEWLSERGVFLIGSDTMAVEHLVEGQRVLPVHVHCLPERGIHLLENMALEALGAAGAAEFLFVCLPLKVRGASGSPVRPVALMP